MSDGTLDLAGLVDHTGMVGSSTLPCDIRPTTQIPDNSWDQQGYANHHYH